MGPHALPGRVDTDAVCWRPASESRSSDHPSGPPLARQPMHQLPRNFFPLGYALENFDPIGRWRTEDQAGPVDASAALVDGTSANGPVELRIGLIQRPDAFRTTITERLLAFAAG